MANVKAILNERFFLGCRAENSTLAFYIFSCNMEILTFIKIKSRNWIAGYSSGSDDEVNFLSGSGLN